MIHTRRNFLAATGASLALKLLPSTAWAAEANTAAGEPAAIKVLSCNIRLPLAEDEATGNAWNTRRAFCANVIRRQNANLIALQECREVQLAYLLEQLPGFQAFGLGHPDIGSDRVNPILYESARFNLATTGGFWLSETPHIEGSKSWDSARGRFVNWVQLVDRNTKQQFRFWNTHLDHIGDVARERGAALVVDAARALPPSLPQLLAGDFNAGVTHPALKTILDAGWIDTYAAIHGPTDPGFTAHHFLGPAYAEKAKRSRKIDWILCHSGTKVLSADIIRDDQNGRYPSDHYFVSATVSLPVHDELPTK